MSLTFKRVFLAALTALILLALVWSDASQASTTEQWLNELGQFVGPYAG